jgi:hypothetical protein
VLITGCLWHWQEKQCPGSDAAKTRWASAHPEGTMMIGMPPALSLKPLALPGAAAGAAAFGAGCGAAGCFT